MADYEEFEEEEFTTQFNGGTLARILGQVRPHWRWVVGFLVAIALVSSLDSVFTYLSKRIIDEGIVPQNPAALRDILPVYGVLILVQAVGVLGFIYLAGVLGERVQYDLRKQMFNHLQELSFSYFNRTPVGWIMSRVTSDSERIAELVTWGMLDVTWAVFNIDHRDDLHAADQLAAGADRAGDHPDPVLGGGPVQEAHPGAVPRGAQDQLEDHRRVQREHHRRAGGEGAGPRGRQPGRVQRADERDVPARRYRAAWLSALFLPAVQIISVVRGGQRSCSTAGCRPRSAG